MRIRYKKWARKELEESKFYTEAPQEYINIWKSYFENENPIHLELGCGKGQFISQLASDNLNVNYIAIDLVDPMLGLAKRNVEEEYKNRDVEPKNIMLVRHDIERINEILGDKDNIERIYINFCNPWPKGQHRKKRLTYTRQLQNYKKFLCDSGEIYFKTDDDNLFGASLKYFEDEGFEIISKTYDLHSEAIFKKNIVTEHEKMFSEEGIKIKALIAKKRPESSLKKVYITSESVTEGHPDKVCDLISDSILDEYLKLDENARVAVEVLASNNKVVVAGQVSLNSNEEVDIEKIVRKQLLEIGYDDEKTSISYKTCIVEVNITKQSRDISQGVDNGGAGDQGMMIGYACSETNTYMPYAIYMAHKLSKRLSTIRKEKILPYIKPDGKTQVTVEYIDGKAKRIEAIVVSTQHEEGVEFETLKKDVMEQVIKYEIPKNMLDSNTKIYINPTGNFVIGGPLGDTGLTRKKNNCRYIWKL